MKSRALGRKGVVVGDRVRLVGDTSGADGSLARIVTVDERVTVLRRTADDDDPVERVLVANADQLVIVTALADPEPRQGLVDRALVAAYDAGMDPLLCLTKADLADPEPLLEGYRPLGVPYVVTQRGADLDVIRERLAERTSVLIGHSGVGKSTLVNALVPDAFRSVGVVNAVTGRGRHTSTSAWMLALPGGGWIVDTPGIRSFGLAHVDPDKLIEAFPDLDDLTEDCPRGCTHGEGEPECGLDEATGTQAERVRSFRRLLASREAGEGYWTMLQTARAPASPVSTTSTSTAIAASGTMTSSGLSSTAMTGSVRGAGEAGDVGHCPERDHHDHREDPHRDLQPMTPLRMRRDQRQRLHVADVFELVTAHHGHLHDHRSRDGGEDGGPARQPSPRGTTKRMAEERGGRDEHDGGMHDQRVQGYPVDLHDAQAIRRHRVRLSVVHWCYDPDRCRGVEWAHARSGAGA